MQSTEVQNLVTPPFKQHRNTLPSLLLVRVKDTTAGSARWIYDKYANNIITFMLCFGTNIQSKGPLKLKTK
jgi:hypothetical protein